MTISLSEGFERGTAGAALAPGNTFFAAFNGAGARSFVTNYARQNLAAKFVADNTGPQCLGYINETVLGGPVAKVGLGAYVTYDDLPPAGARIANWQNAGSALYSIAVLTSGRISIRKVANGSDVASSTAAVSTGATFRWDAVLDCGTGDNDGSITVKLYFGSNVDGDTPDETLTATDLDLPATINNVQFGIGFGSKHNWTCYFDDLSVNTSGDFPGAQLHTGESGGGDGGGGGTGGSTVNGRNWELMDRWDGSSGDTLADFDRFESYKRANQGPTAKANWLLVDDPQRSGKKLLRMQMRRYKGWLKTTANGGDGSGDAWYGARGTWTPGKGTGSDHTKVDGSGHALVIRASISAAQMVTNALMWWFDKWPPEVDLFETWDATRRSGKTTVHKRAAGADQSPHPQAAQKFDADLTERHTWRCEWRGMNDGGDFLDFFFDGTLYFSIGGAKAPGQTAAYDKSFIPTGVNARVDLALAYTGGANLRAAGRNACDQDIEFIELYKLSGSSDTVAPTDPSPVTGTTNGERGTIYWTWPACTDDASGMDHFEVQHQPPLDENWYPLTLGTPLDTSIKVGPGLWDDADYTCRVRAWDRAGNHTDWQTSAKVTTETAPDEGETLPAPVAVASVATSVTTGSVIPFDGSGVQNASGGAWDYGDGTSDDWSPDSPIAQKRYPNPGVYDWALVVSTDDGQSATATGQITVTGEPTAVSSSDTPINVAMLTMEGEFYSQTGGEPLDGYVDIKPMGWRQSADNDLVLVPEGKTAKVVKGVLDEVKLVASDDPSMAPTGLGRDDTGYLVSFHIAGHDQEPVKIWPSLSIPGHRFNIADVQADGTFPAVDPSVDVPGAPATVSASVDSDGVVTIGWDAPENDGGADVDNFRVVAQPSGGEVTTGDGITLTAEMSGLPPGDYTFVVAAHNVAGWGPPSDASDTVTVPDLSGT